MLIAAFLGHWYYHQYCWLSMAGAWPSLGKLVRLRNAWFLPHLFPLVVAGWGGWVIGWLISSALAGGQRIKPSYSALKRWATDRWSQQWNLPFCSLQWKILLLSWMKFCNSTTVLQKFIQLSGSLQQNLDRFGCTAGHFLDVQLGLLG